MWAIPGLPKLPMLTSGYCNRIHKELKRQRGFGSKQVCPKEYIVDFNGRFFKPFAMQ